MILRFLSYCVPNESGAPCDIIFSLENIVKTIRIGIYLFKFKNISKSKNPKKRTQMIITPIIHSGTAKRYTL
jgi:hypothetical protein